MSFIATMVSTAVGGGLLGGIAGAAATGAAGAGLGAGVSAATGGDIGEGALMGGISGLAGGALSVAAPALQGAGAATEAAKGIGTEAAKEVGKEAATEAIKTGTEEAIKTGTEEAIKTGTEQAVTNQGIAALPNGATTMPVDPTAAVNPASQTVVNPNVVNPNVVNPNVVNPNVANGAPVVQGPQVAPKTLDPSTFEKLNVAAKEGEAGWGESLLSKAGIADAGTTGGQIGGQALENAVYGAGINGLLAGAQGQDVGKAMGVGAVSGGIGGAAAGGLGHAPGAVGEFARAHPTITSGAIGMGANAGLNSMLDSSGNSEEDSSSPFTTKWRVSKDYKPYISKGTIYPYAQGGITDLDAYDQAPQMQSPGTLDIPNRNEVANNQGYMGDSVQLMAHGGISDLGGYSDGGRLLKGPGDGVSDDIPASIGGKQPARLAEGEFVVPARIVSELGNGSTDAGAKRLYQMMERIQSDRKKTTGKGKFSDNPKAYKHLPA
jgi:hypothetical protein